MATHRQNERLRYEALRDTRRHLAHLQKRHGIRPSRDDTMWECSDPTLYDVTGAAMSPRKATLEAVQAYRVAIRGLRVQQRKRLGRSCLVGAADETLTTFHHLITGRSKRLARAGITTTHRFADVGVHRVEQPTGIHLKDRVVTLATSWARTAAPLQKIIYQHNPDSPHIVLGAIRVADDDVRTLYRVSLWDVGFATERHIVEVNFFSVAKVEGMSRKMSADGMRWGNPITLFGAGATVEMAEHAMHGAIATDLLERA